MRRLLTSALAILGAAELSGCYAQLRHSRPGERPGASEVVLIGVADASPHLTPTVPLGVVDAFGVLDKLWLGFSYAPTTPVTFPAVGMETGINQWAVVLPGKPFAVVAPRRDLYLRIMRMYSGPAEQLGGNQPAMNYMVCTGRKQISVAPGDEYLYVGTVLCEHKDQSPVGVRVVNQRDDVEKDIAAIAPGATVRSAAVSDLDANPAGSDPVHAGAVDSRSNSVRPALASGPAPKSTLRGNVRFVVGGRTVGGAELAKAAGYETVALEVGSHQGDVGSTGDFSVPVVGGELRVDHLVFKGPGAVRKAAFFPARVVAASGSSASCVGHLELTWASEHELSHDGFPSMTLTEDCSGATAAHSSPAADLSLPTFDEPLALKLLSAVYVGLGMGASGTINPEASWGARWKVFSNFESFGTIHATGRASISPVFTSVMAGVDWGPWGGDGGIGVQGGLGTVANVTGPAVAAVATFGAWQRDLVLAFRADWLTNPIASGMMLAVTFTLEIAPLGLWGRAL